MVKPLLGGQTMLNEFNKRRKNEFVNEDFVGGHTGESVNDGVKSEPPETRLSCIVSLAHKQNQDKINGQVGVDASRRLHRLKVKQNLINNDCPSTILATRIIPTDSEFVKSTCKHNCGSCGLGYKKNDFKPHTQRNGMYERYYLKLGRSMFTEEERAACKLNCRCDTDLNWRTTEEPDLNWRTTEEPEPKNTVNLYVSGGTQATPYYRFYTDSAGTHELLPNLTLSLDTKYVFYRLNNATTHPFYISDAGYAISATNGIQLSGDGSATVGITGNESFTLIFNDYNYNSLYYYCTTHSDMINTFSFVS